MKRYNILLLVIILFNFNLNAQSKKSKICEKIVIKDSVQFCLPVIYGYSELLDFPEIKEVFRDNSLIGVYFNDTVDIKHKDDDIKYDDYFQISIENTDGLKPTSALLKIYSKLFTSNYIKGVWDVVQKMIVIPDKFKSTKLTLPIILDSYSTFNDVYSFLMVENKEVNNKKTPMIFTINMFLANNKIYCLTYYDVYKKVEKKDEIIKTSDRILKIILDSNR